jgi:hypothetical protein
MTYAEYYDKDWKRVCIEILGAVGDNLIVRKASGGRKFQIKKIQVIKDEKP